MLDLTEPHAAGGPQPLHPTAAEICVKVSVRDREGGGAL